MLAGREQDVSGICFIEHINLDVQGTKLDVAGSLADQKLALVFYCDGLGCTLNPRRPGSNTEWVNCGYQQFHIGPSEVPQVSHLVSDAFLCCFCTLVFVAVTLVFGPCLCQCLWDLVSGCFCLYHSGCSGGSDFLVFALSGHFWFLKFLVGRRLDRPSVAQLVRLGTKVGEH